MLKEVILDDMTIGKDLTMPLERVLHVDNHNVIFFSPYSAKWRIATKKNYDQLKLFFSKQQSFSELGEEEKTKIIELWDDEMLECANQSYTRYHEKQAVTHPTLLAIKLTNKCNYRCEYCYDFRKQPIEDKRYATENYVTLTKQILDKAGHFLTVVFHGGEPLLRYDFIKEYILSLAQSLTQDEKKRITFAVQTNASLLNDEMIEFFEFHGVTVGISLDGHTDDMNLLRKTNDAKSVLTPVKDIIKKHPDFVRKRFGIISVVSKKNIEKIPEFSRWVQDHGIGIISFSPLYLSGRGEELNNFVANSADFLKMYGDIINLIENKEIWELKIGNIYGYINCLLSPRAENLCFRNPCGAYGDFLVVDTYEGKIRSCDCTNDDYFKYATLDDIISDSNPKIWQKINDSTTREKLLKRADWLKNNDCKKCLYFYFCNGTCVGQALANLGTDLAVNKVNCDVSQFIFPLILKDLIKKDSIFFDYFKKHIKGIET